MPDVPQRKLSYGELQNLQKRRSDYLDLFKRKKQRKLKLESNSKNKHRVFVRPEFSYGRAVQHIKDIMRED